MGKFLSGILAGSLSVFFLLGSSGVVHAQDSSSASKYTIATRLGGATRFDTAEQIADEYIKQSGPSLNNVILATGNDFPDSLSANVLAAKLNAPILLISDDSLDKQQLQLDSMSNISSITILGGTGAVSAKVESNILKYQNYLYGFDMMYGTTLDKYKQLKDAGYSYVCRYYSPYSNCLTPAEANDISSSGLKIVPIYEDAGNKSSYFNASQGTADAQNAIKLAQGVGQPAGTTIYFGVDFDAQTADFTAIDSYFDAVKSALNGQYKVGVYGSYYVINEVSKHLGQDTLTWQTRGWSNANINTNCKIYQYQVNTTLFGISIDKDMTYSSDISKLGGF